MVGIGCGVAPHARYFNLRRPLAPAFAHICIYLAQSMLYIQNHVLKLIFKVSEPTMTQTLEGDFNPTFHFLGLVQKAIADGVTRHCVHPGCPDVYIVPAEYAFYMASQDIQDLQALCLAAPFDVNVKPMPDWHPDTSGDHDVQAGRTLIHRKALTATPGLIAKPLSELLWYATLCASEGKLLHGCRPDTPVRLMSSPDFSRLFHREHEPILAAFMLESSVDLFTVAAETGISLFKVFEFYNACEIIGLIEQDNAFNPANYLPGLLEKAKADRLARRCALAGGAPLVIVPAEGKYYTELDAAGVARLCATPLPELDVGLIDNGGAAEEVVQIGRSWVRRKKETPLPKGQGRPLSDLLFRAALYASQGRLLHGHLLDSPVRLNANPDKALLRESATIPEERHIFPLTAFMTANKAMTLHEIAKATQQPLEKVINFHNACAITGLLETS